MANTPNLNLYVEGNDQTNFIDWRNEVAGPTNSNMHKIDDAYQTLSDAINNIPPPADMVTCPGGAVLNIVSSTGTPPHTITINTDPEPPLTAADSAYDNTTSGASSTDVQDALDELFTSVGDGKDLLASAITDMGIPTAQGADFQTLADNIRSIQTGVDTSDATAQKNDIAEGKTAYVNGNKITGVVMVCEAGTTFQQYAGNLITDNGYTSGNTNYIHVKSPTISPGVLIRSNIDLYTPASQFGDAKKSDVVSGKTFTSSNGLKITGTATLGYDTWDATVTSSDVLQGVVAYGDSGKITGTIGRLGAQTFKPTQSNLVIQSGQYLAGNQTILGDTNLLPQNIKQGVTIFGVTGTYSDSGSSSTTTQSIKLDKWDIIIKNNSGYKIFICYSKASTYTSTNVLSFIPQFVAPMSSGASKTIFVPATPNDLMSHQQILIFSPDAAIDLKYLYTTNDILTGGSLSWGYNYAQLTGPGTIVVTSSSQ